MGDRDLQMHSGTHKVFTTFMFGSPLGSSETPHLKILLYVVFAIPLLCLAWLCSAR